MGQGPDRAEREAQAVMQRRKPTAPAASTSSVVREAYERSQAMLMDSEARAREIIAEADTTAAAHLSEAAEAATKQLDDADQYAMEVLRRLENQLQAFLESIRMSIGSLQEKR
jgi:hypothetical protein